MNTSPSVSRSRILNFNNFMLALTILPSLFLVIFPIYEADVLSIMAWPMDAGPGFWMSFGRPALYPIVMPIIAVGRTLGLPVAAHLYGLLYTGLFAVWLLLLAQIFSKIMESRRAGVLTACFICLHFHFYEARTWSGSNVLLASLPIMAMFIVWLGGKRSKWQMILISAVALLVSFNLHQSGAFFLAALVGLSIVAELLKSDHRSFLDILKSALPIVIGALIASLLYGLEIVIASRAIEMQSRSHMGGLGANLFGYAKKLFLWGPAFVPLPQAVRTVPWLFVIVTFAVLFGIWKSLRGVPVCRIGLGVLVIIVAALISCVPAIMTTGVYSSRVLLGALVALWGGVAIALNCGRWKDEKALRLIPYFFFAAALFVHIWGFGFVVAIKNLPVRFTSDVRFALNSAGIRKEDTVTYRTPRYESRVVGWSDSGYQAFSAPWGAKAIISSLFTKTRLPVDLIFNYQLLDKPGNAEERKLLVRKDGLRDYLVDGGILIDRQIEIERLFLKPFGLER